MSPASLTIDEQVVEAAQHCSVQRMRAIADAGMLAGSTRCWTHGPRNAEDDSREHPPISALHPVGPQPVALDDPYQVILVVAELSLGETGRVPDDVRVVTQPLDERAPVLGLTLLPLPSPPLVLSRLPEQVALALRHGMPIEDGEACLKLHIGCCGRVQVTRDEVV